MQFADELPAGRAPSGSTPRPLIGPRADLLFTGVLFLLFPAQALLCRFGMPLPWVQQVYQFGLVYPHYVASLGEAFCDDAWRRQPVRYVALPALLVVGTIATWCLGDADLVLRIRFYWGVAHVAHQQAWLLASDRRHNGLENRRRDFVEHVAFVVGQLAVMQLLLRHLGANPLMRRVDMPPWLLTALLALAALATLGALAYLAHDLVRGQASRFSLLIWIATTASFVFMATFFRTPEDVLVQGFYLGYVAWHCAQYVWWTAHARERRLARGVERHGDGHGRLLAHWLALFIVCLPVQLIARRYGVESLISTLFFFVHAYFDSFLWNWKEGSPRVRALVA